MIDATTSLLQFLLSSAGVLAMSEAGSATMWAVVAAAVVFVLSCAVIAPEGMRGSIVRPPRAIDSSVAVAQSDPDAPGHARSRAPGVAAPAA